MAAHLVPTAATSMIAIALSVIPGVLAALAIVYAIRHTPKPAKKEHEPIRIKIRPVLHGPLGRLVAGISIFEIGNCAATPLILRATELLAPGRDTDTAPQLAIGLYVAYNIAATLVSLPAGHFGDRTSAPRTLVFGVAAFAVAYTLFAVGPDTVLGLAPAFVAAGVGIGIVETAEHAAVATLAPRQLRGSAFGLLAAVQSGGNLAASAIAGILHTTVSPAWAFGFLATAMVTAMVVLIATTSERPANLEPDDEPNLT